MTPPRPVPGGGAQVDARGWGWRHAGRARPTIEDLDLTIEPGQRVLLLGASGSGKSTLLHGFAGLLGGSEDGDETGRLLVEGAPPAQRRNRIGMVLQNPDGQVILPRVGDDVAFGMENFNVPRDEIWPRVRDALTAVGLPVALDSDTSTLSGGQKQRLALAGVLAMAPGLILLDEPTANLDPAGVQEVRDAVAAAADRTGATLVVIEHRTSVWLPVVDRVIVLDGDGRILADGPAADTVARERDRLTAAGVWVPDGSPTHLNRERSADRDAVLVASGMGIGQSAAAPLSHRWTSKSPLAQPPSSPDRTGRASPPWRSPSVVCCRRAAVACRPARRSRRARADATPFGGDRENCSPASAVSSRIPNTSSSPAACATRSASDLGR